MLGLATCSSDALVGSTVQHKQQLQVTLTACRRSLASLSVSMLFKVLSKVHTKMFDIHASVLNTVLFVTHSARARSVVFLLGDHVRSVQRQQLGGELLGRDAEHPFPVGKRTLQSLADVHSGPPSFSMKGVSFRPMVMARRETVSPVLTRITVVVVKLMQCARSREHLVHGQIQGPISPCHTVQNNLQAPVGSLSIGFFQKFTEPKTRSDGDRLPPRPLTPLRLTSSRQRLALALSTPSGRKTRQKHKSANHHFSRPQTWTRKFQFCCGPHFKICRLFKQLFHRESPDEFHLQ